jgi:dipeptidyl aminopeptidase/acylaminoacyl peptidase
MCSLGIHAQTRVPRAPARLAAASRLTIDDLVDIKHPSGPVWSRDSRQVAFMWERAGVANLYVVPADASRKPIALTTDGEPVSGVFWSADSTTVCFTRGGTLMQVPADGSQPPRPVWSQAPGRGLAVSRDGTRVAYLVGGAEAAGRGGRGGRGATGAAAAPQAGSPTEIRVRSLATGSDQSVTIFDGPISALSWTGDSEHLTFSSGGTPAQVIRHEQTPAYSGVKIIYTITENVPGTPGQSYIVDVSGGAPKAYSAGPAGGFGGRGANRWLDASHFLVEMGPALCHAGWRRQCCTDHEGTIRNLAPIVVA